MLEALISVYLRGDVSVDLPGTVPLAPHRIIYGVKEKSRQVVALLAEKGSMSLEELYAMCESRSELVATFISVLELCSAGHVSISFDGEHYSISFRGGDIDATIDAITE